jgi:hypothetical protein
MATPEELDRWLDDAMGGYTRDQLWEAFGRVKNKTDWKDVIDCIVEIADDEDRDLIHKAVTFFTATVPAFKHLGGRKYRVTADGYHMGPAGDH